MTDSSKELAGKVALVTGAAKNIGRATALELAKAGAAVAVNTRHSVEDAKKVVEDIRAAGGQAEVYVADIADGKQCKAMVDGVMQKFGRVDFLVLNASVRTEKPFLELGYDEWRMPLAITLDGAFYLSQAYIPSMVRNGGGSIVTLGGMMSLSGAKSASTARSPNMAWWASPAASRASLVIATSARTASRRGRWTPCVRRAVPRVRVRR